MATKKDRVTKSIQINHRLNGLLRMSIHSYDTHFPYRVVGHWETSRSQTQSQGQSEDYDVGDGFEHENNRC